MALVGVTGAVLLLISVTSLVSARRELAMEGRPYGFHAYVESEVEE